LDSDERIAAIKAIFQCDESCAHLLDGKFRYQHRPARALIARQGDPSRHCWIIVDGLVGVQALGIDGQKQQLAQHGPGELFGAYPGPTTHRAEILALDDTSLLCAEASAIAAIAAEQVAIASAMAILLARQLDRALDRMVARTTYSAAGRVYARLLELSGTDNRIEPPPRITTLALSANTTRETASRAIAVLVRRGIVQRDENALVILAPRMLLELVC
jgi:CRP-like cAMP-binding protein